MSKVEALYYLITINFFIIVPLIGQAGELYVRTYWQRFLKGLYYEAMILVWISIFALVAYSFHILFGDFQ